MTLTNWIRHVQAEIQSARASGLPNLWHTDFKALELEGVLREITALAPRTVTWTAGDAPPPRAGESEPARVCFVTCERNGVRFVTRAQYNFGLKRWFFENPPSGVVNVVAWMDAPPPYEAALSA